MQLRTTLHYIALIQGVTMQKLTLLAVLSFLFAAPVFAADDKPSEDSIRQLLEITQARKLIDSTVNQVDGMLKNSAQAALRGQPMTPERQKILDKSRTRTMALLKEELNWDSLQAIYVDIYRNSFTQEEVNGLITFYKTPSGQALIRKMPVVMQQTMVEVQTLSVQFAKQFDDINRDMITQLDGVTDKAADKSSKH